MKINLLLILSLFATLSSAQFSKNHFIYASIGDAYFSDYDGGDISLNYINNSKYSLAFSYSTLFRKSPSQPDDYQPFLDIIIFQPNDYEAYDQIQTFKLLAGKIILTNNNKIRFNLKGGIAYSRILEVSNWVKKSRPFIFSSWEYYEYDISINRRFGIALEPSLEFPIGRFVGASVTPFALINEKASTYGCTIKLMLGLLRPKTKETISK